ncbi:MAG: carbohydrate binding domain-containing protein, partial [Candidatus Hydrogenedentota bacterium]
LSVDICSSLKINKIKDGFEMDYDLGTGFWVQVWQNKNLNLKEYTSIKLKVAMQGEKNRIEIKLVDSDGTNFGYNIEDMNTDGNVKELLIPFSDFRYFWGGDSNLEWDNVKSIWIAISKMNGGKGKLAVTSVELSDEAPLKVEKSDPYYLPMESSSDWRISQDEGTELKTSVVAGNKGNAVALEYDLVKGKWVQIYKNVSLDLIPYKEISLWFKATGNHNRIELKLVDKDGTNYGYRIEDLTRDNKWHRYKIPFEKFEYFWGGDNNLDAKNIISIWIAISEIEGFDGEVAVDEIEFIK